MQNDRIDLLVVGFIIGEFVEFEPDLNIIIVTTFELCKLQQSR